MLKIETHLHTDLSSFCGKLSTEEILQGYSRAGYSAIVVTDHYSRNSFLYQGVSDYTDEKKWELHLGGYLALLENAPEYGIRIFRAAEIGFDESLNDYLVFGCPDELLKDTEQLFTMGIAGFSVLCRQAGGLLIQAHPYRRPSTPAIASYLDGIEIYNAHPRHDSRNWLAEEYAQDHKHLICFAGSDCHRLPDIGLSGIEVEELPANEKELVSLIEKREFSCIIPKT